MDEAAIYNAIREHVRDGKRTHPVEHTPEEFNALLPEYVGLFIAATDLTDAVARNAERSRRLLQVAGLCVRAVQELGLPLTPPKE